MPIEQSQHKSDERDLRHSVGRHLRYSAARIWGFLRHRRRTMKALVASVAFLIALAFASQAFAMDMPACPNGTLKHGHYVCADLGDNS